MTARLTLTLLAVAASAFAQTTEVVDTLFMNDAAGTRRVGHVVGIDAKSFQLEVPLTVGPAGASARVAVPRAQVSRIEFAPNEARDRLIANPTAASTSALNIQWLRWQAFLAVPKSPAGAIANAYATALLATNDPKNAATALDVFSRVEREGWSEADRQTAKQGRLRAMIATGHAADAVNEAKSLAKESEDPTVLIEAKFILAEAAFSSLKKLVEDNPRWTEDVLVRPEHDRLYNERSTFTCTRICSLVPRRTRPRAACGARCRSIVSAATMPRRSSPPAISPSSMRARSMRSSRRTISRSCPRN